MSGTNKGWDPFYGGNTANGAYIDNIVNGGTTRPPWDRLIKSYSEGRLARKNDNFAPVHAPGTPEAEVYTKGFNQYDGGGIGADGTTGVFTTGIPDKPV